MSTGKDVAVGTLIGRRRHSLSRSPLNLLRRDGFASAPSDADDAREKAKISGDYAEENAGGRKSNWRAGVLFYTPLEQDLL